MSRFGLRSASDGLKQLEEKPNRRKTCNPVSISMKRNSQPKDIKYATNIKDENIIDDIKIEIEDGDKISESTDGPPRNKIVNEGDDDEDDDDGAAAEAEADANFRNFPSSFKGSLICSLPLERIHDVIQKLNLTKSKIANNSKQVNDNEAGEIDESVDNDDDDEDDNNISKQSTSTTKNLCLYCDKKFSSHKMQQKHVEKFHCLQQDRRCSGRNSQMQQSQSQTPRKRKPATGSQTFVGCSFCPKNKGHSQSVILPASDLSALFLHLADCHADKYFGCKMCVLRFQNISKLSKHMEIVHKSLAFAFDESSSKSKDNDTDSPISTDKSLLGERSKLSLRRQHRSQKPSVGVTSSSSSGFAPNAAQCTTPIAPNTSVIGAEEPILSRLGLTQNRLPNNRKGVRLRREKLIPEMLLKSEQNHQPTTNYSNTLTTSSALASSTSSPKLRGKAIKAISGFSGDTTSDVIFRVPTRNDILSCVFDDNFYKEVVSNVRNNLLFHLDGKIMGNSLESLDSAVMRHTIQPQIRSTLVKSPIVITTESEIHAATSLAAITAFPTLLTAEQFGGDGHSSKLRRPHTKNSWKWKWDSVKKFKLVNEGGKIVKKMKHPMLGLRDLSKLDMWTQLTMRQKHEMQSQQPGHINDVDTWTTTMEIPTPSDASREEKQRLNDQLNMILDMRLLPHIILEQNEQAIIKVENDEFGIAPTQSEEDCGDNFMAQTFADESFLSMLNLLPNANSQNHHTKLVLSGEWARPRCYLCMCCGAKFEKLKSLDEHKMFRHSQILSTHYEVVGRELLNGNLLRHLFLPKKALSRYANDIGSNLIYTGAARRLFWHKNETLTREITNNEESSDSLQSMLNSCTTNSLSIKNSSSTEDCDADTKIATATALGLMVNNAAVVSPTHSIQSCSSSSSSVLKSNMKVQSRTLPLSSIATVQGSGSIYGGNGCSKCGRKCNGVLDLYRHMLDCSGDYVWSLAKKRKYRYYCGSKKRRPCNKHSILELRKNKSVVKPAVKSSLPINESTEEGASTSANFSKTKTSPRPRPSDAESIKKMLENLPPKRVCKKIFPTINKTKKNIKNIKPKLLAKHKIYNSLRKTRVRQMSQAAKILSKTKSQLQKSKRMTTRSATTPSLAAAANKRNNRQKSIKILMDKKAKGKPVEKVSSPNDQYKDDTVINNIKVEHEKTISVPSSTIDVNVQNNENYENTMSLSKTTVNPTNTSVQSVDNIEELSKATLTNCTPVQIIAPTPLSTDNTEDTSQNVIQKEILPPVNIPQEAVSKVPTNLPNAMDLERQAPNNKNIKRSKRISDCIAMLTGKLEQKLKTEQTVYVPVKPAANIAQQPAIQLPPSIPSIPTNQSQQDEMLKNVVSAPVNVDVDKNAPSKKTPKRKTISRRIIKTDVADEISSSVKTPDTTAEITHNVPTSPPTPVNVTAPRIDIQQSTRIITIEQLKPLHVIEKTRTTSSLRSFAPAEGKPTKTISPTVLVPPMPSVMPLNNHHLITSVPLYVPVENLCVPHMTTLTSLPLPLPVPAPAPLPSENVVQHPPVANSVPNGPAAVGLIAPSPTALPLITTAPPAHLPGPAAIALPVASFSIPVASEPLNLSSSSKKAQKQSQDLSFSNRQKMSGIPTRRQTICGFEARNFVMFDEMEPLDLSNKTRPEKASPSPIVPILPKSIELTPILLPAQHPLPLPQPAMVPVDGSLLPIPPITPEALLNKPFYSNLDLLRIPQVRNPAVGQGSSNPEPTPPQPPLPPLPSQPSLPSLPSLPSIVVNNNPIPSTTKSAAKKRSKSSTVTSATTTPVIHEAVGNIINNSIKSNNAKDTATTGTTKKESSVKGKLMLRMDEEVINHIDDAINSVINAVNASLDSEEAEKSHGVYISPQTSLPKTTDDVNVSKESVGEFKFLTAARRNMRSKTLDCRPAALNKLNIQNSTTLIANNHSQAVTVKPYQTITVRNIDTLTVPDTNNIPTNCINALAQTNTQKVILENPPDTYMLEKNPLEELPIVTLSETKSVCHSTENSTTKNLNETSKAIPGNCLDEPLEDGNVIVSNLIRPMPLDKNNEITKAPASTILSDTDVNIINPRTVKNTNLDLEQMSNNNNTSSGFHSSAQSDQQISVMSTTTSVSTSMAVTDTKKKQRRRRKNELAAIVADQLLESFKLDKARRDNLKKLENLAYEKSEDLLLTGMLLMSSTKRNVTSSSSAVNSSVSVTTTSTNDNNESSNKRNATKSQQNAQTSKINDTIATEVQTVITQTVESDKTAVETIETTDNKKNNKRKQYRRRGKTLDNENISKLKSSLESFSIDIERQLSEYEAKNVNVFKSVSGNEVGKPQTTPKSQSSTNSKSTVILRPSILSVTLEASANVENPQVSKALTATTDANKTVISSRDPRLNKNIHKEGEKNTEVVVENKAPITPQKNSGSPEEIGDLEEDNYLTEIAKNVNEKIMSTENEEFAFKDDGFEMANDMGMDDSNSKFSRPPTSMSVRSAPNFNDDRSNFGSICDENTNTEVMDMDLDDEMSVYTSYSQDLGRGRGRRRRRRRSILLTRKPKKRASSRDLSAEKIECILCKKVFYSANSLSKHNMTLAHVSKVSEQEYLLSKSLTNSIVNIDQNQSHGTLGPYARRSTRRATISEPPMHMQSDMDDDLNPLPLAIPPILAPTITQTHLPQIPAHFKPPVSPEATSAKREEPQSAEIIELPKTAHTSHLTKDVTDNDYDGNNGNAVSTAFNGNSRLNLNPDERLFFECCNILKSAETPRLNNVIVPEVTEECNNLNTNYSSYVFRQQDKSSTIIHNTDVIRDHRTNATNVNMDNTAKSSGIHVIGHITSSNNNTHHNQQPSMEQTTMFRDPQSINVPNCYNRSVQENRNARSPTYSAISHLSAVTNTTSRFKTKAAMKGYENVNIDLMQQQESKSRTICKLTELAEIALGNEDKPNSHSFSPIQSSNTPSRTTAQNVPCASKVDTIVMDGAMRIKGVTAPDYGTMLAVENPKESNVQVAVRNDRTKNNETRSSTSSKTIMHSSIIKAAVEEHQKTPICNKIIIPDRPFKNIGLEEKETITFQKPKTPAVHLLTEDNNSLSTGSFSDRDDYDFGSLSCDEEASVRESNEKNLKNNTSESSSESSRATAKTFENKSLIMGRIFKNVSTKASVKNNIVPTVKVKSVGVQKDQAPTPKADLNQLFDELRGNSGVDGNGNVNDRSGNVSTVERGSIIGGGNRLNHKQHQREIAKHIIPAASPPAVVSSTTATPSTNTRKTKPRESRAKSKAVAKTPKDISKLQSELGMSPDEIKKLIDEGQRKSKRRCATNRPKKLVEMWSSDEYEEFLSTKDIIALIEEKEQEEKRKKRKNSVNMSCNNSEMAKEKETPDVTSSTKDTKRRNTRKSLTTIEPQHQDQGNFEAKSTKTKKVVKKEDPVSTTAPQTEALKMLPESSSAKKLTTDNTKAKRATSKNSKSKQGKQTPKTSPTKLKKETKSKNKKPVVHNEGSDEDDRGNDSGDDNDDDFLISHLKLKQVNKKSVSKAKALKTAAISAPTVTSTANVKSTKSSAISQPARKRSSNNLNICSNTPSSTETVKTTKQLPAQKNKRKSQANQSPPRRKRPATEKLYYWSSSSDEEFGRINNNKSNAVADNFESGGEQYQKHGWIVGDSHKKLVTLLAIAKGNKKVDGVKKNITKKRN